MQSRADRDGAVLVYPVATGSVERKSPAWNARTGAVRNMEADKVDDVAFISHLMDIFLKEMNVDPDRVYVTGTSLGGREGYRCIEHKWF